MNKISAEPATLIKFIYYLRTYDTKNIGKHKKYAETFLDLITVKNQTIEAIKRIALANAY